MIRLVRIGTFSVAGRKVESAALLVCDDEQEMRENLGDLLYRGVRVFDEDQVTYRLADKAGVDEQTRSAIASMVADRARKLEDGPEADDGGSAFRALRDLARELGYLGRITPHVELGLGEARQ